MPWRLVQFIVLFVIFLIFMAFNVENKCNIRFFFTDNAVIEAVPVYLTAFFSFIIGMLCALPFIFGSKLRKKGKVARKKESLAKTPANKDKDSDEKPEDSKLPDSRHYGID